MARQDARRFVTRMREDQELRDRVLRTAGVEGLAEVLRQEGMCFDLRDLVGAMAECMAQMEQQIRPEK